MPVLAASRGRGDNVSPGPGDREQEILDTLTPVPTC